MQRALLFHDSDKCEFSGHGLMTAESTTSGKEIVNGDTTVRLAKDGSLSGLGDLLEKFRPLLLQMANAKIDSGLRRRLSESDVVQQTMLTASTSVADFRGSTETEFRNWLLRIFESRLADGFRRHRLAEKRRTSNELAELPTDITDPRDSPSGLLQSKEDSQQLLDAVLSLPEPEREIVLLRYSAQKSFEAIADQMEMPLTTVWRRWSQAVDQLKVQCTQRAKDD